MSDIQQQIQQAADHLVDSGAERGLQIAVYHRGVQVVEVAAGTADPATGRPVTPGTVFYNYSIGKAATATVVHVLAGRGLFGYDTPVAELWPAFAAHGKEEVTVRQVLDHTAGVPGLPLDTTVEDICDWERITARVADEQLWWQPGEAMGYHAYTFGYILGEVVRRVTGKPVSQVLAEDVAGPLGFADELYFGMPVAEHGRLAVLEDRPGAAEMLAGLPEDLPMFKAGPVSLMPTAALGNRTDVLAADIPAGAKTSARAVATMYAALLGSLPGHTLISPQRLHEATSVSSSGPDRVFGPDSTWGLGYALGLPGRENTTGSVFGMAGAGGSYAFGDTEHGIAFALTKNRLDMDFDTLEGIVPLVYRALADQPG
ncbi:MULTISPECIES: EstA family serine hydrolase [Streptomyces]|uniref:EstA family serine hydrolase n=1 Tax=Streptomyces tsukubensis (strain DSM 42081 / NBRC 108919 / NRRL 18488 / 9993) TaxID=1114943 RepID=I2MT83_STRT9|nr:MULTISPECIES: EstA family serine hydrolase [Streptomyces]AZK92582.1 EstA family serine hydrolase [Streptomyces tsukubensis]EIF87980.1 beta-lactamase [Streptomyces tsukubensis NRRL18488]MYS65958.1 EstA family serine hydrolase [Streptomyces sp. SID5473]QKM71239.1 EstA family serine hydrolase [Streptomyces tsukubensis NRRL18488]TAI40404.1 EstA family serine hydrolase [Streptomyces tsukubensis]